MKLTEIRHLAYSLEQMKCSPVVSAVIVVIAVTVMFLHVLLHLHIYRHLNGFLF